MINKERYNFDDRFSAIADKVLTFNGIIPSSISDTKPQRPHDFESYQMQNDPDYAQYKNGNFYTGFPSSQQQQPAASMQNIRNNNNNNKSYSGSLPISNYLNNSPQKTPNSQNIKRNIPVSSGNLFQVMQLPEENQPFFPLSRVGRKGKRGLDDSYDSDEDKKRKLSQTGEMILQQNQRMFEAMQAQQYQFQMQLLQQQQLAEAEHQRQKEQRKQEKLMAETLQPIISNQQKVLNSLLEKVEQRNRPRKNQMDTSSIFSQQMAQILLRETENRRAMAEQQQALEMQRMQQEKQNQDANMRLAAAMLGGIQPQYYNPYSQQMPYMASPQPPKNAGPNLKEMQSMLFAPQKNPRDNVIEGFLKDIKRGNIGQ